MNGLRVKVRPRHSPGGQSSEAAAQAAPRATRPVAVPSLQTAGRVPELRGRLARWLILLERAKPIINALARATLTADEPLERRGWGDTLLGYRRKK